MQSLAADWNFSVFTVLLNIDPHFLTDAIAETGCGLKDNFVCTKLSVRLIIMPITAQEPGLGSSELGYLEKIYLYIL